MTAARRSRYSTSTDKGHACFWPGCVLTVPGSMYGCRTHWFTLPKEYRDRIWKHYRPGQERDLSKVTREYAAVHREIMEWTRKRTTDQPVSVQKGFQF